MNLTALQNSPFLQSLGWAIANSLWQAAVLWITYHLIIGVYKNASAKFKNNLSTVLLTLAFLWFCFTLFIKYFTIENYPGTYKIQYYSANDITSAATWNGILDKVTAVLPYLSLAYLLLLIFFSFRLINIYRVTGFIKSYGLQKPGVEWKLFTEKVALHMGITKKVKLWVSHHIDVPATIGFLKPVILIPFASINQLSVPQLEAIILHELSHIKRNDYLINLFISIIETILFFNPFIVLLAKVIKRERENCCDDLVIQYQYDRHTYASALLSLEQFRNLNLRLAIGATSGKKQLLLRVKRIMEANSNTNFNYGQKVAALLLITGVICSVAWFTPQNKEGKKELVNNYIERTADKRIIGGKKPETLFIKIESKADSKGKIKLKSIGAKPVIKKIIKTSEKQLKELQNLNLKEIADIQKKFSARLLVESQKQIVRKNSKIRLNRLAMLKGSNPIAFNNLKVMLPGKEFINGENFSHHFSAAELQKMQAEFDKAHFSISFDFEEIEKSVKQAALNSSPHFHKIVHGQKIECPAHPQIKKRGKILNNPEMHYRSNARINSRTLYKEECTETQVHNLVTTTRKVPVTAKLKQSCDENNIKSSQRSYTYEYIAGDNKENIASNNRVTAFSSSSTTNARQATVSPDAQHVFYHSTPRQGNNAIPKARTSSKSSTRSENKPQVIIINGRRSGVPDNLEVVALYSIKGKKLLSKVKNLVDVEIEH